MPIAALTVRPCLTSPEAALVEVHAGEPRHVQGQAAGERVHRVLLQEGWVLLAGLVRLVQEVLDDGRPGEERAQRGLVRQQGVRGFGAQARHQLGRGLRRAAQADGQLGGDAARLSRRVRQARRQRGAAEGDDALEQACGPAMARPAGD